MTSDGPRMGHCCSLLAIKTKVWVFVTPSIAFSSMSLTRDGFYLYGTCTDNRFFTFLMLGCVAWRQIGAERPTFLLALPLPVRLFMFLVSFLQMINTC